MLNRRLFIGSGLALAACGPQQPGLAMPLRVATYRGNVETYLDAAGLKQPPYKIERSQFASGNLITEAIDAGAIDLGSMSDIPPIFAATRQTAVRLVAVLEADVANQLVLVPKGSPVTTLAGLKGKRIGYVRATTSHYILLKILDEAGLTLADVTAIALAPQDGRAAFTRGDLDAWIIFGVVGFQAMAETGARVLATGVGRLTGNYVYAAASEGLADPGRRAAIGAYLRLVRDTWAWTETHPDQANQLVARAIGVPETIYAAMRAGRSTPPKLTAPTAAAIASQQQVADRLVAAGLIPARVDVASLWERDFDYQTA
jgi:sulfonate transport system substrate-binding protein